MFWLPRLLRKLPPAHVHEHIHIHVHACVRAVSFFAHRLFTFIHMYIYTYIHTYM